MANKRSKAGDLLPDTHRFPSGIQSLADTIHSMGLKFGIYESAGYITCQHLPGSLGTYVPSSSIIDAGYEDQDAKLFSSWGNHVFNVTYWRCGLLEIRQLRKGTTGMETAI